MNCASGCINNSHHHNLIQHLAALQASQQLHSHQQAQVDRNTQASNSSYNMGLLNFWSNDSSDSKDDKKSNDSKPKPPALPRSKSSKSMKDNKLAPALKTLKEAKARKAPKTPKIPKEPKKPKEAKKSKDSKSDEPKKSSWFSLPQQYEPAKPPFNLTKAPNSESGLSISGLKKADDSKSAKSNAESSKNAKAADMKGNKSKDQQSSVEYSCDCPHD